jgi:mono/diheme cytochrome c family protein
MKSRTILVVFAFLSGTQQSWAQSAASPASAPASSPEQYSAMTKKYCIGCHNEKTKTAGLVLEKRDLSQVASEAPLWEKVVRKLRAGEMPPSGMPRPDKASLDSFAGYLEDTLDQAFAAHANPGRVMVHRLNRTEYSNAVRDVLRFDVDTSTLLPPDDSASGFDNIAQALTLSPVLMDRYVSASAKIARMAVGDPQVGVSTAAYRPTPDLSQDQHIEGLPLGTVGGLVAKHYFPLDGEYVFEPKISRSINGVAHGLEDVHALEVTIDGARVSLVHFGGVEEDGASHRNGKEAADLIDARFVFRMKVSAGTHTVGLAFLRHSAAQAASVWQQFLNTTIDTNETSGAPHLDKVIIAGPFNASGPGDTPSRRAIFICRASAEKDELPCARKILTNLARKAYRRPVNGADMETLLSLYQNRRNNKGTFEQGIEMAIRRVISGPEFLFRIESDPATGDPKAPYRISDIELASRLSFFLWSTVPDDQLYNVAVAGKLHEQPVLEAQVRRMLADPKANALVSNFADQWLQLRNLRGVVPDPTIFPDFDDNLRQAMVRETELLFGNVMRQNRPVTELLTADYTFINERLARHYGIPGIYGDRYRKIAITDESRKGLLGQASILTLTSVAIRTSPVGRGKWILINMLGTPPAPPPPNVPALNEAKGEKPLSMRERMAAHRANPVCATCHKVMDPIGFSLENFDAVGRWRMTDNGARIDAADSMYDGTKVEGAVGLREFLLNRGGAQGEVFIQTVTEKLLTYALGRPVDYYDMPAVRKIVRESAKNNYRFADLILGIVSSTSFEMRVKGLSQAESASAKPAERPVAAAASVR